MKQMSGRKVQHIVLHKAKRNRLYSVPVIPMEEAGVESTPELCMLTPEDQEKKIK